MKKLGNLENEHPKVAAFLKNKRARQFLLIGAAALVKFLLSKFIFDAIDQEEADV